MKRLSVLLVVSILFSGCAWWGNLFGTETTKTAIELAHDGMDEYNSGSYYKAIKSFETLKDWYPFSKFAMLAELKIGDAQYQLEKYEEAIAAYEEFENLHPRNEAVPYVIYQIGRCYFDRLDTIDRDQSNARLAFASFRRLIRKYPQNSYAEQAAAYAQKCLQSLAGHELYVGLFYFKAKNYKAALGRFRAVIGEYPDTGMHLEALQHLTAAEKFVKAEEARKSAPKK